MKQGCAERRHEMLTQESKEMVTSLLKKADQMSDDRQKVLLWIALGMDIAGDTDSHKETA